MGKEKIFNIPNALSFYRIIIFPFILYLLFSGQEYLFSVFLCINLFTDLLDGFIARTFHMVTRLGARLDSLGDYGTYILAFGGVFKFKSADLSQHGWILYLFLFLYITAHTIHFIRFKNFPSMHLYSFKVTGYLQGLLFFLWFFIGFFQVYYFFAIGFGILAVLETIVITFILNERHTNAKGLYWLLNE